MLHIAEVRSTVQHLVEMLSPGPSGKLLTEAAAQGASGGATAAIVGLVGALLAGMFAVAQVERSANRLCGLDRDRPTAKRYRLAFLLAIPVGTAAVRRRPPDRCGWPGRGRARIRRRARVVWEVARWPLGLLWWRPPGSCSCSVSHRSVDSAPPGTSWPAPRSRSCSGGVFTGLLSLYFAMSNSTSQTYGPLLAVIALLLWAGATSLALHLGITACVELER